MEAGESAPARALAAFGKSEDCEVTAISTGLINQTFSVTDASGRSILQCVNPIFPREINSNIAAVTDHLRARGHRTFELYRSGGQPYVDLGADGVWRLTTMLPGVTFDLGQSPDQVRSAGQLLGSFHSALQDFHEPLHPIGFPFHDTPQHKRDLIQSLRDAKGHPLLQDVTRLSERILRASESLPLFDDLPERVIHGDPKFNNVLFESSVGIGSLQTVAMIDLDTLARMPLWVDWGDALRSWCNREEEDQPRALLDLELFSAASEGLMSGLTFQPTRDEIESLGWGLEWISLELSMRFATDALLEKHFAWDSDRYERSGRHQLDRARGQFSLFEQSLDSHEARVRFLRG